MKYISTRGKIKPIESMYAAAGIYAKDGGLYAPEVMPRKIDNSEIICLAWLSHARRMGFLFGRYLSDVYSGLVTEFGDRAFVSADFNGSVIKLLKQGDNYFAEMQNGPSGSPFDVALRPLPILFEYCLAAAKKGGSYILGYGVEPDENIKPLIIVPSTGDEALALINATTNLTSGKVAVVYPEKEISGEKLHMLKKMQGENVCLHGMDADIDEISLAITRYMRSNESSQLAETQGLYPMRGDGQSWFGIVSHAAFFISAYCEMLVKKYITLGEQVNFSAPYDPTLETLNAAFYAKGLGSQIEKIICAAPRDSIFSKLVTTGELDGSCVIDDMFIPSALERLIHAAAIFSEYGDGGIINDALNKITSEGRYKLPSDAAKVLRDAFYIYHPDNAETDSDQKAMALAALKHYESETGETRKTIHMQ